jgi:hypothetical protein
MKMKRLVGMAFFVVLLVSALPALSAGTLKGTISDKMCGADHKGQDPVACTRSCVKGGSPYVLVESADKILDIENQKDPKIAQELDKYAGKAVTVTGTLSKDGKSVKIASLKAGQ